MTFSSRLPAGAEPVAASLLRPPGRCAVLSACRRGARVAWLYAAENDPGRLVFVPEGGAPAYDGRCENVDALIFFDGGCRSAAHPGQTSDAVRAPDPMLALDLVGGHLEVRHGHAELGGSCRFLAGDGTVGIAGNLEIHGLARTLNLELSFPEALRAEPARLAVPLSHGLEAILRAQTQSTAVGESGDPGGLLARLGLAHGRAGAEVRTEFRLGLLGSPGDPPWAAACCPPAPAAGRAATVPSGDAKLQVALLALARRIKIPAPARISALGLPLELGAAESLDLVQYPAFPWWPPYRYAQTAALEWVLELRGIPSGAVLAAWNRSIVQPYRSALRTADRGEAVTFLPRLDSAGAPDAAGAGSAGDGWTLRWLVRDAAGGPRQSVEAASLAPPPRGIAARATFDGCCTHGGQPLALAAQLRDLAVTVPALERGPFARGLAMALTFDSASTAGAGQAPGGGESAVARVSRLAARLDRSGAPRAWIDVELPLANLRPGGEDGVPTSDTSQEAAIQQALAGTAIDPEEEDALHALLDREAPLIVPLEQAWRPSPGWVRLGAFDLDFGGEPPGPAAAKPPGPATAGAARAPGGPRYFLRAEESNESAHFLALQVRLAETQDAGGAAGDTQRVQRVVVLDRDPFLAAEVDYPDLRRLAKNADTTVVASWSNQGADGPGWQVLSDQQTFDLVLPPQGIGEQMVKAMETLPAGQDPNLYPGLPMDFRFAPPARLSLQAGALPARFTEAPWNLRRVLGYPGQRDPGAGIASLRFEMLYGLACRFDNDHKRLRLAEIFALLGAIGAPLPPAMEWTGTPAQEMHYRQLRRRWAALIRRYHGRLAVLQPWASLQAANLVLDRGMSCSFRPAADLAIPPDQDADPMQPTKGALPGGATWGFEQKNVFQVTMRFPDSSSAQIVNPMFSSLGGWGSQKAGFQNDLSSVVADVEMGRTSSYAVERIGRIGVFWNLAKHVILYERSVAPSAQFADTQPAYCGRALLRKVEEYIEVMEPKRAYPEDASQPRIAPGFISAIQFMTVKIPVDPRWGANVGAAGWKIPLWSHNVAAHLQDVYPKPHVVFEMAAQQGGKACTAPVEIDQPEKLCFYTSTAVDADGDPHRWAPVPGVDGLALPRPAVRPGEFATPLANPGPPEPAVARGHELFTYAVTSMPLPANVVASRSTGAALSATIQNVTMMRSLGAAPPAWNPTKDVSGPADAIQALDLVEAGLAAKALGGTPADAAAKAAGKLVSLTGGAGRGGGPGGSAGGAPSDNPTRAGGLAAALATVQAQVLSAENNLAEAYQKQVTALFAEAAAALASDVEAAKGQMAGLAGDALAARQVQLNHDLAAVVEDAGERLKGLPIQPEAFLGAVDEARLGSQRLFCEAEDLVRLAAAPQPALAALRQRVRQLAAIADGVRTAVLHKADGWGLDPSVLLKQPLQKFADGYLALDPMLAAPQADLAAVRARLASMRDDMDQASQTVATALAGVQPPALAAAAAARLDELAKELGAAKDPAAIGDLLLKLAEWQDPAAADAASRAESAVKAIAGAALDSLGKLEDRAAEWESLLTSPPASLDWPAQWRAFQDQAAGFAQDLLPSLAGFAAAVANVTGTVAAAAVTQSLTSAVSPALEMVRAYGLPPAVQGLAFDLPNLAYYFSPQDPKVGITPILACVDAVRDILQDPLKALGTQLPSTQLLDRFIPAALERFNLADVLPNFAGLKLANLFPSVRLPSLPNAGDNVHVTHGADPQSQRAWLDAAVDLRLPDPAGIFALGPLALRVVDAHLEATVHIEVAKDASSTRSSGSITGQWEVLFGGMTLVTFVDTALTFDETGHLHFGISADRVRLAAALGFLTDALKAFGPPGSGLSIGMLPAGGVRCTLDLPIPPVQAGTFGISNLRLGAELSLLMADARCPGLGIGVGFSVARHDAPFNLAVCILGGSGYIEATALYGPFNQYIESTVDIGIYASASLGISLGPINGFVYVGFGVTAQYRSNGAGLNAGINVLVRGGVTVLGFIDALVCLSLSGTYRSDGTVVARGQLSISIRISWLFTLNIDEELEYHLAGHSAGSRLEELPQEAPVRLASLDATAAARALAGMAPRQGTAHRAAAAPPFAGDLEDAARRLLEMYVLEGSEDAP